MTVRGASRLLGGLAFLVALALIGAACSDSSGASAGVGSDGLSVRIASPAEGATVPQDFTVELDANVALDDPDTGEHHVHLCFDDADCDSEYTLVYGDSIPVSDLAPGTHTIEASLRNADHSDAGAATASITVTVAGPGTSPASGAATSGGSTVGGFSDGY